MVGTEEAPQFPMEACPLAETPPHGERFIIVSMPPKVSGNNANTLRESMRLLTKRNSYPKEIHAAKRFCFNREGLSEQTGSE